jgi:hypothetical protein
MVELKGSVIWRLGIVGDGKECEERADEVMSSCKEGLWGAQENGFLSETDSSQERLRR